MSIVENDIGPSRWYYALALLALIAGGAIFFSSLISGISGLEESLTQVVVPGTADLELNEVGEYTVFYENQSFVDGKFYSTGEDVPGLEIEVTEKSTGDRIEAYPLSGSASYSIGSRSGMAIMAFSIDHPGIYQISADYAPGQEGPEVVLAVGNDAMKGVFSTVMVSMAALFGSMIAALAIVTVVYMKRKKAAEELEEKLALDNKIMRR